MSCSPPSTAVSPRSTPPLSQLRLLILEPSLLTLTGPTSSASSRPYQQSLFPSLLEALTDQLPLLDDLQQQSFAGYTTHPPLRVRTRYFDRRVGIWCDEIPLPTCKGRKSHGAGGLERQFSGESAKRQEGIEDENAERSGATRVREGIEEGDLNISSRTEEDDKRKTSGHTTNEAGKPTTQIWLSQMLSVEASEVRSAIGAIILTVPAEHAVEPMASPSRSMSTSEAHPEKYGDNDARTTQPTNRCRLRDEYLDIISAVNTLRSTINEERAEGAGDRDHGGQVGAILVLQGSVPTFQAGTNKCTSPTWNLRGEAEMNQGGKQPSFEHDAALANATGPACGASGGDEDDLVEAVEEQLLTARAVFGWDVVVWDRKPTSNEHASHSEEGTREAGRKATSDSKDVAAKRNAYGERIGISRVHEVLHETVDWSALPSKLSTQNHNYSRGEVPATDAAVSFPSDNEDDDDYSSFENGLSVEPHPERAEGGEVMDEEIQVEQLQGLLQQAMAIREVGSEMPRAQREKYAQKMMASLLGDSM